MKTLWREKAKDGEKMAIQPYPLRQGDGRLALQESPPAKWVSKKQGRGFAAEGKQGQEYRTKKRGKNW